MDATAARPIPDQQPIERRERRYRRERRERGAAAQFGYLQFYYSEALRLVRRRFERDPDFHLVRLADSRDPEIG